MELGYNSLPAAIIRDNAEIIDFWRGMRFPVPSIECSFWNSIRSCATLLATAFLDELDSIEDDVKTLNEQQWFLLHAHVIRTHFYLVKDCMPLKQV